MADVTYLDIHTQRLHKLRDIGNGQHALTGAVVSGHAGRSSVTLTRTADTNAYTAGDVVGSSTSSGGGVLTFEGLAPAGGGAVMITSASLLIAASSVISGEESGYRLYLYSATPGSALADNAAWDLPSGDRASYLGSVNLGTPIDLGSTLYIRSDQINMQIQAEGADVFGYLVTVGAYTPTSARVYVIHLHSVGL